MGLLDYIRSSFERAARTLGRRRGRRREQMSDRLIESFDIPPQAVAISVAYDHVRLEMDETELDPEVWPDGRLQPREIRGRMIYYATVTLHDERGEALWSRRYGQLPRGPDAHGELTGEDTLRRQVRREVDLLLEERGELAERAVYLSDGASELERIGDEDFPDWPKLCDVRHLMSHLDGALEASGADESERASVRRRWLEELESDEEAFESIFVELLDRCPTGIQTGAWSTMRCCIGAVASFG
jgi:hypothetical protein